jgi:hypothetical protein
VNDFEVVKARLQEINRSYHEKSRSYDTYYEQYQRAAQEILLKRQALDAFNEAIIMFDEQVFPYLLVYLSDDTVKRGNIEQVINFKVKLKILGDVL